MSVSAAAQSGPPRGPLFSQQQDGACQRSQVEGRTGPTSPVPFPRLISPPPPPPPPIHVHVHCFRPSETPRAAAAAAVSPRLTSRVSASDRHTEVKNSKKKKKKKSSWTMQGSDQTMDWSHQTRSVPPPRARRRSKKTRGTSASHASPRLALMIAHSSVKCKAAHCTALRRHTDSDSITEAAATSLAPVRWSASQPASK